MKERICTACGTQLPETNDFVICPICADDRQYVPEAGQSWTTHDQLVLTTATRILKLQENLYELTTMPRFAIGQRALLVLNAAGNILWDCIPLLNDSTIEFIKSKGGIKSIAISHPHYYSNMNDWAKTFNCPIYIHKKDEQWVFNNGTYLKLWDDEEKPLWNGMRIINIGGHFPGSCILYLPTMSTGETILCGDTVRLSPSKKHFSVMYSYPNLIPLALHEVKQVKERFAELNFNTLYGFWSDQNVMVNAKRLVMQSLARYV